MRTRFISLYRTELMGIAILGVVFYHMKIDLGDSLYLAPLRMIKAIGYGGVDLFFFLSGFGLVCGWLKKRYRISDFYKKRLVRILPTYWLWMLLNAALSLIVFKDFRVRGFIADFFGIGFLSGKSYNNWFVPAIVVCYLAFPFIISFLLKKSERYWAFRNIFSMLLFCSCPALALSLILVIINANQLIIFSSRIPNFMLGLLIGLSYFKYQNDNLKDVYIRRFSLVMLIILGLILLFIVNSFSTDEDNYKYGFWWYPFSLLTFPLCLLLANTVAWLYDRFSLNRVVSIIRQFLSFCGSYSLEIYLMHELFFSRFSVFLNEYLDSSELLSSLNQTKVLGYFLLAAISISSAYLLSRSVNWSKYFLKRYLVLV